MRCRSTKAHHIGAIAKVDPRPNILEHKVVRVLALQAIASLPVQVAMQMARPRCPGRVRRLLQTSCPGTCTQAFGYILDPRDVCPDEMRVDSARWKTQRTRTSEIERMAKYGAD